MLLNLQFFSILMIYDEIFGSIISKDFNKLPPSLTTLGIEASMMTSEGTCKLVIPLALLTIAKPGLVL
jgi:hypothetical protein